MLGAPLVSSERIGPDSNLGWCWWNDELHHLASICWGRKLSLCYRSSNPSWDLLQRCLPLAVSTRVSSLQHRLLSMGINTLESSRDPAIPSLRRAGQGIRPVTERSRVRTPSSPSRSTPRPFATVNCCTATIHAYSTTVQYSLHHYTH